MVARRIQNALQLKTELLAIAAAKKSTNAGAEFIYQRPDDSFRCQYVHVDPEDPESISLGCIFGIWLVDKCGVPVKQLIGSGYSIAAVLERETIQKYVQTTPIIRAFANGVQAEQDRGVNWTDAVNNAWIATFEMIGKTNVGSKSSEHSGTDGIESDQPTEVVAQSAGGS